MKGRHRSGCDLRGTVQLVLHFKHFSLIPEKGNLRYHHSWANPISIYPNRHGPNENPAEIDKMLLSGASKVIVKVR